MTKLFGDNKFGFSWGACSRKIIQPDGIIIFESWVEFCIPALTVNYWAMKLEGNKGVYLDVGR